MSEIWVQIVDFLSSEQVARIFQGVLILVVGFVLAKVSSRFIGGAVQKRGSAQHALIARRLTYYLILGLVVASALSRFGFDLTLLLGAAGILTVAIGFASQTSASNLISGLFLLGEQPFVVNDVIRIGNTTGEVVSVDLLSVKLRTFDNLLVRVPNESLLKSEITNLTHFPIRRCDIPIGVAYGEDFGRVQKILFAVADRNPICLDEPKPQLLFLGFGDSAQNLQFSVWSARENFLALRNSVQKESKAALDEAGIEIPFPHRSLYAGAHSAPLPIRIVGESDPDIVTS